MLPDPASANDDIVAIGADLDPGTLLDAYRHGLFPMRMARRGPLAWWSPDPRGIIPLDGLRVSRSLRRSCRRFDVRVDTCFEAVMGACADPTRPDGWIDESFVTAYTHLHELGWAHSVEVWTRPTEADPDPVLAGGLYGIAIGALFAGESMFHHQTDASKVALVGLVERLQRGGGTLLDVQWCTDHLASFGAIGVPKTEYLRQLELAVASPQSKLE